MLGELPCECIVLSLGVITNEQDYLTCPPSVTDQS